jgi:hypothetical protein
MVEPVIVEYSPNRKKGRAGKGADDDGKEPGKNAAADPLT